MPTTAVDLNCDLGELPGDAGRLLDLRLMRWISSANIACGGHAGDANSMRASVQAARELEVAVGAHPGFEDRDSMGRRPQSASANDVRELVHRQIQSLHEIAQSEGLELAHVKLHGALYHLASADPDIADAVCAAILDHEPALGLFALSGSLLLAIARARGLNVASEVFADRQYLPGGQLVPRDQPRACLDDPQEIAARAVRMVREESVSAMDGTKVSIIPQTICLHGDHPQAEKICAAVADQLSDAGIRIRAAFGET